MDSRLEFCKVCKNQAFNPSKGMICGLTNEKPDFEETCPNYIENVDLIERQEKKKEDSTIDYYANCVTIDKRLLNFIIDSIMIAFFGFGILIFIAIISELLKLNFINSDENLYFLFSLSLLIAFFVYYVVMENANGQTIGKLITKSKVVNLRNGKPDFSEIMVRTIARIIPFYFLPLLITNEYAWHDTLSGTKVISSKRNLDNLKIPEIQIKEEDL